MKIALVTSQVTYIPHNYDHLIMPLLELPQVTSLIELKNQSPELIVKAFGLAALGVKGVGKHLARNCVFTSTKRRKKKCQEHQVSFAQFKSMNEARVIEYIREQKIDLIINLRTRCIYKDQVLETPRLGCINVHHGLLPKYRGTMCDLYALFEGRPAGFSVHKMEKRVDAGEIFRVQEVSNGDLNYCDYLLKTNAFEFRVLKDLILEIEKLNALPKGSANECEDKPIYTKNPTPEIIKKMLAKGMIL